MTVIQNFTLIDKTYEDLMNEAFYQIPLLCREWTNFNLSDPGITTLEILSATNVIQQAELDEVTDMIRKRLLALPGIYQGTIEPAHVYMALTTDSDLVDIPANTVFRCGDMFYETEESYELKNLMLADIFSEIEGQRKSFPNILRKNVDISIHILGKNPSRGDKFYILLESKPLKGKELFFYITIDDGDIKRNALEKGQQLNFASLQWQYYTETGWENVGCVDETRGFVYSGVITLDLKQMDGKALEGGRFGIRCVVDHAEYDIPPKIKKIDTNIFKAVQQKSMVAQKEFCGANAEYKITSRLLCGNDAFSVYVKEEGFFREYTKGEGHKDTGRFYRVKEKLPTGVSIEFDESYRQLLEKEESRVKIVIYSEDLLGRVSLGGVYAYDDQIVETELQDLVAGKFKLFLKQVDDNGVAFYEEVAPDVPTAEGFLYTLTSDFKIKVISPGIAGEGELIWTSVVQSLGANGNIREGSTFVCNSLEQEDSSFFNVNKGTDGKSAETIEDMRKRFIKNFGSSATAITATDYKEIIKETGGLAIRKVNVGANYESNLVKVTAIPYSKKTFPSLSKEYRKNILATLEQHRLLTTRVQLEQPKYVPVDIYGTVYVKAHFNDSYNMIYNLLERELDFINSEEPFGSKIVFGTIYNKVEELPCVEYIYNLSVKLSGLSETRASTGEDIQLEYNELCHLGNLRIEIINKF